MGVKLSQSTSLSLNFKLTICALTAIVFVAGCGSTSPPVQPEPVSDDEPEQFWLCGPNQSDDAWNCEEREEDQGSAPRVSKIAVRDPMDEDSEISLENFLRALEDSADLEAEEAEAGGVGETSLAILRNPPYRSLAHFMESNQTLLDLSPSFFAVEIASSESRDEIDTFIVRIPSVVRSLLRVVATADDETTQFIVLLGVYRDKNRADVAALSYRNDFEGATTTVHPLGDIQAGIRAASELQN